MIGWTLGILLASSGAQGAALPQGKSAPAAGTHYAQLIVREQIIVRVPPAALRRSARAKATQWREGRGPRCVRASMIRGAALLGQNSVDLLLKDNRRIRAKLVSSCPALDYYAGFYVRPNEDGLICAQRDVIRSRVGGQCGIERFARLWPAPDVQPAQR